MQALLASTGNIWPTRNTQREANYAQLARHAASGAIPSTRHRCLDPADAADPERYLAHIAHRFVILRPGLTPCQAADTAWVIASPNPANSSFAAPA